MFFPLSALKEHIETDLTLDDIVSKLTMIGIEVESLQNPAEKLNGFIVAEIKSVSKHPQADRLSVLMVDTGAEVLQVVCGAPNVKTGLKGVFAPAGTVMPQNGEVLKKGVIRGVESNGMMCAEDEVGLSDNHEIIIELPADSKVGTPFADIMGADPIIEVKVTANRSDCLGVYGIARDLAASGAGKLKQVKKPAFKTNGKTEQKIEVKTENCPLFVGRLIKNVKNGPSPEWLQKRLKAFGLRPISALVDMTNYMTLTYNRPMHVFDADKIKGALVIDMADKGKMDALDDKAYELNYDTIVISDENGIQSFGGIIGGVPTSVDENTKNVLVESAYFKPEAIAKAGRRLKVQSDARYRFERGIDPAGTVPLEELGTQMILDLCGGEPMEANIQGKAPANETLIPFTSKDLKRVSGVTLDDKSCDRILTDLGMVKEKDGWKAPSFRHDIGITEDLVEEVLRIYGYDKIEPVSVEGLNFKPVLTLKQRRQREIIRALAGLGLNQAITVSFSASKYGKYFNSKHVALANPITPEMDELRPSLLINLIEAAGKNQKRGVQNIALFEVGPAFSGSNAGDQSEQIGIVRAGFASERIWLQKQTPVSVFDIKADVVSALAALSAPVTNLQITADVPSWYHPSRAGAFKLGKTVLAYFGELHPQVLKAFDIKGTMMVAEIFTENLPEPKAKAKTQKAMARVDLPVVRRDFSFIREDGVTAEKLIAAIKGVDKTFITNVAVFDVFEKSIAIEVTFTPVDKTLTDPEIEGFTKRIIETAERTGAKLRQ